MASHETGVEARESDEGMTNFEPYVAGKVRVSLSMVSYSRGGKQRRADQQSLARARSTDTLRDAERGGEKSAPRSLFQRIRSSLSMVAGLPQPPPGPPPGSRRPLAVGASSGATKRPAAAVATRQNQQHQQQKQEAAHQQPRVVNAAHHSSAPVLHKPTKGVEVRSSPSPRATSSPIRGDLSSLKEGRPLVIEDMVSFGPGSGRSSHPPLPPPVPVKPLSTNQEQSQSERHSKSEEPPTSPKWVELETSRTRANGASRDSISAHQRRSLSGEPHHISLMSYSDVPRHRARARAAAAKMAIGSDSSGGSGTSSGVAGTALPPSVKQQLNRQDVLKRIGSIENDEVSI